MLKLEELSRAMRGFPKANPPATIKEAQSEIEALTGIRRSETQVREFLKKTAFTVSQSRDDPGQSGS